MKVSLKPDSFNETRFHGLATAYLHAQQSDNKEVFDE